jgi:hypothetical protein
MPSGGLSSTNTSHYATKAGFTNTHVCRNADNAKEIIVWSEILDVAKARDALASQEIRNAMQEAGVVGPPKIHVIA